MRRKGRKWRARRRILLTLMLIAGVAAVAVVAFAVVKDRALDDNRASLEDLTTQATSGDATAQLRLGVLYADGSAHVRADPSSAFRWFEKAADQGLPEAQEAVGEMLLTGNGTRADSVAAMVWYEKAALQGWAKAQGRLRGTEIQLPYASVMGTENAILASTLADGHTQSVAVRFETRLGAIVADHDRTQPRCAPRHRR